MIDDPTRLNEEDWDRIVGVFVHVRKIFWKISKLLRVLGPSLAIQGLEIGRKSGADFLPNTGLSLVLWWYEGTYSKLEIIKQKLCFKFSSDTFLVFFVVVIVLLLSLMLSLKIQFFFHFLVITLEDLLFEPNSGSAKWCTAIFSVDYRKGEKARENPILEYNRFSLRSFLIINISNSTI